jgi:hypothetical protein
LAHASLPKASCLTLGRHAVALRMFSVAAPD